MDQIRLELNGEWMLKNNINKKLAEKIGVAQNFLRILIYNEKLVGERFTILLLAYT